MELPSLFMENWCCDKPTLQLTIKMQDKIANATALCSFSIDCACRGIEWDAMELPSQFMENWCYDKPTLYSFARHYQTGEALPEDMFDKIKAARTFRSGTDTLRQVRCLISDVPDALH
jgi:Zn-dependent oligopeptidase